MGDMICTQGFIHSPGTAASQSHGFVFLLQLVVYYDGTRDVCTVVASGVDDGI